MTACWCASMCFIAVGTDAGVSLKSSPALPSKEEHQDDVGIQSRVRLSLWIRRGVGLFGACEQELCVLGRHRSILGVSFAFGTSLGR